MANNQGLDIDESDFLKMNQKGRDRIIFRNVQDLRHLVKGYKLTYKIMTIIGSFLVIADGVLFTLLINHIGGEL